MNSSDFHTVCLALRDAVERQAGRDFWSAMADVAALAPTTSKVATRFSIELSPSDLEAYRPNRGDSTIGEGLRESKAVLKLMRETAKPAVLKDLDAVIVFARQYDSLTPNAVASAAIRKVEASRAPHRKSAASNNVDEEKCARIVEGLQKTFGKEAFAEEFGALKSDKSLNAATMKKIALLFTGAKAATKKAALDWIWQKHHWIIDEEKRRASVDGRTAA